MSQYESLVRAITDEIPDFQLIRKSTSLYHKFVARFMFFNKSYLNEYTSTLYPKIYYSEQFCVSPENSKFNSLAHEFVHLWDSRTNSLKYELFFLFPQVLSIFSILCIFIPISRYFAIFSLFLIFLLPFKATFRKKYELRAFAMNMAICYWSMGYVSIELKQTISNCFTQSAYYYMWPDPGKIKQEILSIERSIRSGKILDGYDGTPYRIVRDIMKRHSTYRV